MRRLLQHSAAPRHAAQSLCPWYSAVRLPFLEVADDSNSGGFESVQQLQGVPEIAFNGVCATKVNVKSPGSKTHRMSVSASVTAYLSTLWLATSKHSDDLCP